MENRLHGTQECTRFYFSTRYIRLGMTNTSPTLYCICLVTVLSKLKRLKSAIAVFVFEQSDFIFLCVSAIHARRTICTDYVMNYSPEKLCHNRICCPSNRSKQVQETHTAYIAAHNIRGKV